MRHTESTNAYRRTASSKTGTAATGTRPRPDCSAPTIPRSIFGRGLRTIADIGSGRGHLLRAVLGTTPQSHGILFDLPDVIDGSDTGHERMATAVGDFFVDPLRVADVYVTSLCLDKLIATASPMHIIEARSV